MSTWFYQYCMAEFSDAGQRGVIEEQMNAIKQEYPLDSVR